MSKTVIKIENLSKLYRIGEIGTGTISHDLNRWWTTKVRGKEDPYAQVGQVNDRTLKAEKGEHVWALKDINLEVKQGDILGIIGKNGAGKSTLLKLLSRVTSPTTGSIKVKGRLASLLEVGTGFHPEMTGRENIYMNGTIMGMRRWEIDRKLDEIVDFAGIEKYLDTPTKRYSSGMTVRLGFAIAAFLEPEILVVDEVLAVGDAEFQKKALGKMQDVSKDEGRTVLFVSHNMASINTLCRQAVELTHGKIHKLGPVHDVVRGYIESNEQKDTTELILKSDDSGSTDFQLNFVKSARVIRSFCGDPITLNFRFQSEMTAFDNLGCSLVIRKPELGKVLGSASFVQGVKNTGESKTWNLKINMGKVPLLEGNYFVDVIITAGERRIAQFSSAIKIIVDPGDPFGWGKPLPPPRAWGQFYWESNWLIEH